MVVSSCKHEEKQKHGKDRHGNQRYKCCLCGKRFADSAPKPLGDMRVDKAKAVQALRMILEGNSIRSTERLVGINRNTIMALIVLVGERCQQFFHNKMRALPAKDIQCDELWSFIGCKEKTRVIGSKNEVLGDCYTFLAIERDSKLIVAHHVGKRDASSTRIFASKLRDAITSNVQITTDGFGAYTATIPVAMWDRGIHFAQLIKSYGKSENPDTRYSPAVITGITKKAIWGTPDQDKVSTSHVERVNLSLRMGLRRFTRLTNAFSKSPRNHEAAIALWLMYYNFGRVHSTLKTTPAVKAGIATETWSVEKMLDELAGI